MIEFHRSPYFVLSRSPDGVHVRVTRTAAPFPSLEVLEGAWASVERALEPHRGRSSGLLVDVRATPARNDPAFEAAFEPHRVRLHEGFARLAVLVKTMVGKLQVQRHARDDALGTQVFTDEGEAQAYVAASGSPPGKPLAQALKRSARPLPPLR